MLESARTCWAYLAAMFVERANGGLRCRIIRAIGLGSRLSQPELPAVPLSHGRSNLPVERHSQPPFPAPNGCELLRLRRMRSSSPLRHPKWAHDPAGRMPMAPPLVPSPIMKPARPHKVLAAFLRHRRLTIPGLALALKTLLLLVPAASAKATPVEVINPALVLVINPVLIPAINPAEMVGTSSRFRGK